MKKFRVTLAVEAKDAEEAGAFVGTLGAPKHVQWDQPLGCETLEVGFLEEPDPQGVAENGAAIEAITGHIRRRREDPEFMARLDKLTEEDALVPEFLKEGATSCPVGPRTYFFIVHGGGAEEQLTLHASSDPGFIAQLACEDFGGEPNRPASLADAAFDLAYGTAGAFYSIPDLQTFAIGFHSGAVPDAKILQLALRCSEGRAAHFRALVERHQEHSGSGDSPQDARARTCSVIQQPAQSEADMIPVCPKCLSEEVEEPAGSEPDGWRCANCGARFDAPAEASS